MKTTITFKVVQTDEPTVLIQDRIEAGFGEFDRIVKKYTRFNQNSELSNLNRQNGKWVEVSDEFLYLIEYMLDIANKTNGAFDPTIIDFLEVYGYDPNYDFSKLENPELDQMVQKLVDTRASFKEIEIDKKNKKVKLAKNQRLDLGGIGKGYAIDCAFDQIFGKKEKVHIKNFLIDAGGDIRAFGNNEKGSPWVVDLKHMKAKGEIEILGNIELHDEALAASGSWVRKVKQFHHLINPVTGKPKNKFKTVFVKAGNATLADAWATAIFVSGNEGIKLPENISFTAK